MFDFLGKLKQGLQKTHHELTDKIKNIFSKHNVDEKLLEELEEVLIKADVSVDITMEVVKNIHRRVAESKEATYDVYEFLRSEMIKYLPEETKEKDTFKVLLILGVNGSGKTTSIAKLAQYYKAQGKSVLLAAGDTFRAAAIAQLSEWADRVRVPVVKKEEGSDAGAVIYEAVDTFIAKKYDILIIDTAGRLHTKKNLMDELAKIKRIIHKNIDPKDVKTRLVLDATTGNNGVIQAREFSKEVGIDDVLLAKLDSSAKGGCIFSISRQLNLPVRYIGVGEKSDDLLEFSRKNFVEALFD